jgi:hypothetical protein
MVGEIGKQIFSDRHIVSSLMVCAWEEPRARRQRSEQYLTSSQTFAHFLRQTNGRPQVMQFFCGRSDFFIGL